MESPKVEIEFQSCVVANGLTSDLMEAVIPENPVAAFSRAIGLPFTQNAGYW